jgi:hypothetical protein
LRRREGVERWAEPREAGALEGGPDGDQGLEEEADLGRVLGEIRDGRVGDGKKRQGDEHAGDEGKGQA